MTQFFSRARRFLLAMMLAGFPAGTGHARAEGQTGEDIPVEPVHVLAVFPHDPSAFTEGLFYRDGFLWESTGFSGRSVIRKVDPATGEVRAQARLPDGVFGEGIADWHDKVISLTWKSGRGFLWHYPGLSRFGSFTYSGQGWGLTHDDRDLFMSDGTSCLRRLDPDTLGQRGEICVTANGEPVSHLNELEFVRGEIYANIWLTPDIARIDPLTGHVRGWLDLTELEEDIAATDTDAVANGIAYDAVHDRLYVTGKYWQHLYQIERPRY
ncbi:glutaminyl-peptide cyclotransferase [Swaminathania salitolerans]|nr:glutaminyl-peptide cyclotransferase [Swaminathania salitolerans]